MNQKLVSRISFTVFDIAAVCRREILHHWVRQWHYYRGGRSVRICDGQTFPHQLPSTSDAIGPPQRLCLAVSLAMLFTDQTLTALWKPSIALHSATATRPARRWWYSLVRFVHGAQSGLSKDRDLFLAVREVRILVKDYVERSEGNLYRSDQRRRHIR